MSYQGHSEDKDKVLNALGGKKGLIDSGLPSLVFLIVFNLSGKNITSAIYAAIGLSIVLTFIRIVKRETVQHAFSGLIGVAYVPLSQDAVAMLQIFTYLDYGSTQVMHFFMH